MDESDRNIDPAAAFSAGNDALAAGDGDTAIRHYKQALAGAPEVVEIHSNLANAHLLMGDIDAAIGVAEQGLAVRQDFAPLLNTLGNAYQTSGRPDEAKDAYRRAWAAAPEQSSAAVNLAALLRRGDGRAEAVEILDRVLAADNDDVGALNVRALLALDENDFLAAEADLRRALTLAPGDASAQNNLAISLLGQGRRHDALAIYRDVVSAHPDLAQAHANLGQVLQGLGRNDEAVDVFRRTLVLDPGNEAVLPFYLQALMYRCEWAEMAEVGERVVAMARAQAAAGGDVALSPFALAATEAPAELRLKVAEGYTARAVAGMSAARARVSFSHAAAVGEKLRVAYLSPDFREHSVAVSFRPLLEAHDRERFHWIGCLVGSENRDGVTDWFEAQFDEFLDLRDMDAVAAAQAINDAHADVLVDMAGHTRNAALEVLALKPAPVQAHYLGYASTLGAPFVDYLFTDHVHTPPALAPHCSEHLVYLPDSFMAAGAGPKIVDGTISRPDCGLPADGFVFANFNAHYKIDARLFDCWMALLGDLPGSVLWLRQGEAAASENLLAAAELAGIEPARLVFAERLPHAEHLARHRLADLALDCRLHVGGVTTLDALWAGIPVLTMAGDNHASRTGASMLAAVGLVELIAADLEDYRKLALALAREPARLASLKARLAAQAPTAALFDPARLAGNLERAYGELHRRWRDGEAPGALDVAALADNKDQ